MSENEIFLKKLGSKINKIREEEGLSFQEMALRCDLEKSSLVKLANQGTNVTALTLLKISKGLNVSLSEIFDF
jgi:transcriptional regulator with XRE-family HTH domain